MNDIGNQYGRISNRLYSDYINYRIDKQTYDKRKKRIDTAYDRYERNIARLQGTRRQGRGAANYAISQGGIDSNVRYSRSAYAGSNG